MLQIQAAPLPAHAHTALITLPVKGLGLEQSGCVEHSHG